MKYLTAVLLMCAVAMPSVTLANHRDRIDRNDLDDDIAEEFPVPVLFGVDYDSLVPDFGDPRGGGTREHEGQDFRAPKGTPIVSPTEAIVIRTGTGASAGKYVYTANPGGETFRYMHLDYVARLEPGDKLSAGDFIGTVGDTGNAPDGVYHLHFEVRDKNNKATDPFPRMTDTFTLKEKISLLGGVFRDIRNDKDYADFLVETFPDEIVEAGEKGYDMPDDLEAALEDSSEYEQKAALVNLQELVALIPAALNVQLSEGDQGPAVQLLQVYLIYGSEGPARDRLAAVGATGYYGRITTDAIMEHQEQMDTKPNGMYDGDTRQALIGELAK